MTLYNEGVKDIFLSHFHNVDTQEVYSRIFKKSSDLENDKNIDLYDFDEKDYEKFIGEELKPSTKESARTYCNILSSYVQWAIENRYSKHESNPIRRSQSYYHKFVEDKKLYFSFEEKESLLFSIANDQDKFLIQALFEGIQGNKLSEVINLKMSDLSSGTTDYVDFKAHLINDKNEERTLLISSQTYFLALSANSEKLYLKNNGKLSEGTPQNINKGVLLDDSPYIIKTTKTNKKSVSDRSTTYYSTYNRLNTIRLFEGLEEFKDALTTKNIVRSGMIYWAKLIFDRDGKLERKQLEEVCKRFNIKYKWAMKDFLNIETINNLYGSKDLNQLA